MAVSYNPVVQHPKISNGSAEKSGQISQQFYSRRAENSNRRRIDLLDGN
jgi:hypothetical protein